MYNIICDVARVEERIKHSFDLYNNNKINKVELEVLLLRYLHKDDIKKLFEKLDIWAYLFFVMQPRLSVSVTSPNRCRVRKQTQNAFKGSFTRFKEDERNKKRKSV